MRKKLKQRLEEMDKVDDWSSVDPSTSSIVLEKDEEQVEAKHMRLMHLFVMRAPA